MRHASSKTHHRLSAICSSSLVHALALVCMIGGTPANASSFPSRNITIVVPFAAGGAADTTARIMADAMSKRLGTSITVENVGGAGGAIGTTRVKASEPTGYTVGLGHMGTLAAAVPINRRLGYNPRTDFEYLGLVSVSPNVVYVRKEFPANDLQEFIAYARKNGSRLTMGHGGIGAASHVACVMLFQLIGAEPTLVAYRGFGQTVNDLLAGTIDGGCDLLASVSAQAQAGNLRVLAVAADERSSVLPDAPTSTEAGLPAFETSTWTGLFVPAGAPASVVETLRAAVLDALSDAAVQKRLADIGAEAPTPEQRGGPYMKRLVDDEVARWTAVLTKANIEIKD